MPPLSPLLEPLHLHVPADEPHPWRENAWVAFWDHAARAYGAIHVSTSPNAPGCRARASIQLGGETIEIIEPLDAMSYRSQSISYDLDSGRMTVDHPELKIELDVEARHLPWADYSHSDVVVPLLPDQPLHHYQQSSFVRGHIHLRGVDAPIDGFGFRDRTWGFRDEAAQWVEYINMFLVVDEFDFCALKMLGNDGEVRAGGFLIEQERLSPANAVTITRDPAGLLAAASIAYPDQTINFRKIRRNAGFWTPMGVERTGPAFSAYNEFIDFTTEDGRKGSGVLGHGVLRRLF